MANYFSISGYWKDDKTPFNNYIVKSTDDMDLDDDEIFYYGLSEQDIQEAIQDGENTLSEFIITSYEPLNRN